MPVQHLALIRFNEGTPESKIAELFREIQRLTQVIPGITAFVSGPNASLEGLHQGYTHGFIMTFKDAAARDAYLPHPEHERAKTLVLPHVAAVIVFDIEQN